MKLFRYLLPVLAGCVLTTNPLVAQGMFDAPNFDPAVGADERDIQAIEDFLESKRAIFLEEETCNLSISGDVRFEWQYLHEKANARKIRDEGSYFLYSDDCRRHGENAFDVEVNLYLDYSTECTWAKVQIEWDNDAGAFSCCRPRDVAKVRNGDYNGVYTGDDRVDCASGTCNKVCVEQAYFGYNLLEDGCCRLDVEIGRRKFYHVFESRVQFNNRFDGILAKYSNCFECVGDFYVYGGFFIIDEVMNHYGYVVEVGLLDVMDCGLDLRYSFIDWKKGGDRRCTHNDINKEKLCKRMYDHQNSQISFAYRPCCEWFCMSPEFYGGFVFNHAAHRYSYTNNEKENIAFYLGVHMGTLECAGDWSIDVMYQWVEAQAIQECDMSGIGRGNAPKICFHSDTRFGAGNFHGFLIETGYALTDNLTSVLEFEWSEELEKAIGGTHKFYKLELEFIYAF